MQEAELIAIGYWSWSLQPDLPSPDQFIDDSIGDEERQLVIAYLESGFIHAEWMGYSHCRFRCGILDSEMGAACLSDGTYIWPEGLPHYLRQHQVWLPKQFIGHVKSNSPLDISGLEIDESIPVNYDWWKNYA